jgi:biotin carboxyl carrier protein
MTLTLVYGDREYRVETTGDGEARIDGETMRVKAQRDGSITIDGRTGWVARDADVIWVFWDGRAYEIQERRGSTRRRSQSHDGSLAAPMPATVRRILVGVGDAVARGDVLMILEAMKMELPVRAAAAGTVRALRCREGDLVQPGVPLVDVA